MAQQDIYQHSISKFADSGLQLRTPVDSIPANMYAKITNLIPIIEGQLQSRAGLGALATISAGKTLHSLFRLNQAQLSTLSDRLIGVGFDLVTQQDSTGTVTTRLSGALSGNPITFASFRFANDSASWGIIADRNGMFKYRGGSSAGAGTIQALGIPTPTAQATAAVGAAGLLNSTGGPGYDWVYTYLNNLNQSEGSPSPAMMNAASDVKRATVVTTPDAGFGGAAFSASTVSTGTGNGASATAQRQSANWNTFAAAGGTPAVLSVFVDVDVVVAGGTTGGIVEGAIYYTIDGGSTWIQILDTGASVARKVVSASIPMGTLYANIQVRAVVFGQGTAGDFESQQDAGFVIRGSGGGGSGNFNNFTPVSSGNATIVLTIHDIYLSATLNTSGPLLLALVNQQANLCVTAPTDTQVTHIRVYRRGGSVTASWAKLPQDYAVSSLVAGPCGAGSLQIIDNFADTALGAFVNIDNGPPVQSVTVTRQPLPYIWGPFGDPPILFACGDPARPDVVYFCHGGNADQWGAADWIVVSGASNDGGAAVINGCILDTNAYAFTHDRMYQLYINIPGLAAVQPYPTPCARGLISPTGVCVGHAIYFVARDGVYATTGGIETSIVEDDIKPLFPTQDTAGSQFNGYDAVDMTKPFDIHLAYHNDEVYFTYRGVFTGNLQYLIYNTLKKRWRAASYIDGIIDVLYSEPGVPSSLLAGGSNGVLYQAGASAIDGANNIPLELQTGSFDEGQPLLQKEYGNIVFDLDPGGATLAFPVTITPVINGNLFPQAAITVTGTGRQQVPLTLSDVFAFNISFDITCTRTATINPIFYQIDRLWRLEPAQVQHWESRELSYGQGFFTCRGAYVGIRSNGTVTLTITIDSNVAQQQTYTIPSTAGARKKVFIPFQSNVGLLYRFSFDSTGATQFRIYNNCVELHAKPWAKPMGYSIIQAFGLDAPEVTAAYEGQALATGQSGQQ